MDNLFHILDLISQLPDEQLNSFVALAAIFLAGWAIYAVHSIAIRKVDRDEN